MRRQRTQDLGLPEAPTPLKPHLRNPARRLLISACPVMGSPIFPRSYSHAESTLCPFAPCMPPVHNRPRLTAFRVGARGGSPGVKGTASNFLVRGPAANNGLLFLNESIRIDLTIVDVTTADRTRSRSRCSTRRECLAEQPARSFVLSASPGDATNLTACRGSRPTILDNGGFRPGRPTSSSWSATSARGTSCWTAGKSLSAPVSFQF